MNENNTDTTLIKNIDDEWNFDSLELETNDKKEKGNHSLLDFIRPSTTDFTSRFSNDLIELKKVGLLSVAITKLSVAIAARKKDINIIKEYYGNLNELWANIKTIVGKKIYKEIEEIDFLCRKKINKLNSSNIDEDIYYYLLLYRDLLYQVKQILRLGISVERRHNNSSKSKAKRLIVE